MEISKNHFTRKKVIELPYLNTIFEEIELAKLEALEYSKSLGVSRQDCALRCRLNVNTGNNIGTCNTIEDSYEISDNQRNKLKLYPEINLSAYSQKIQPELITEDSTFIKVCNQLNQIYYVTKYTLVRILSSNMPKLSSDRLLRVMRDNRR